MRDTFSDLVSTATSRLYSDRPLKEGGSLAGNDSSESGEADGSEWPTADGAAERSVA
jgi:hypothetical protein